MDGETVKVTLRLKQLEIFLCFQSDCIRSRFKSVINFENDKWVHTMRDKDGTESTIVRWIDEQGRQQIVRDSIFFSIFLSVQRIS